jgi:hypothetical protein
MGSLEVYFFMPQLAPDGKIYFNCAGGGTYLHTINHPDIGGDACDVQLGTITLPHWTFRTMPNFPNFRLGALRGSVCDTLGIEEGVTVGMDETPPERASLKVFPNPANSVLNVEIPENGVSLHYKIYDVLGREMQNAILKTQISLKNLQNGIYFFHIFDKNGGGAYRAVRVVVQHE